LWDEGTWTPKGDPHEGLAKGKLSFELDGKRLKGGFALVRLRRSTGKKPQWLLLKERDEFAEKSGTRRITEESAPPPIEQFHAQLATLEDRVPTGDDWVVEPKFDGYRIIARLERGKVELMSRNGQDWTERFQSIADAVAKVPVVSAVFDGEVCALDDEGVPRFQLLQNSQAGNPRSKIRGRPSSPRRLVYFVFDLLFVDGEDLRGHPLVTRKSMLESVLAKQKPPLYFVGHAPGDQAQELLRIACERHGEGVVAKRANAPHRPVRSLDWLKVKCSQRQEVVIVGFTAPGGSRQNLGALLLGVNGDDGKLRYAGKVGTGFSARTLADLARRLKPLIVDAPPVTGAPRAKDVTWVKPVLVAEVSFTEWTHDGALRHPSFVGLREDKPASEVKAEAPAHAIEKRGASESKKGVTSPAAPAKREARKVDATVLGVRISHPDRVIDHTTGITKLELAAYYGAVAERILPYIASRPLALVRCPEGDQAECFFQKQRTPGMPKSIHAGKVGKNSILYVDDAEGLVSLVQFGAVELHAWGSRLPRVHEPDWIVMDLDPAADVEFERTRDAALAVRALLKDIGLESFLKTTGGKGLHVVAPIEPQFDFDRVKELTRAIAERLARDEPRLYTAVMSKNKRTGRVFVDYLRNGEGATAIAPYAARARPGGPVSLPISWEELGDVDPAELTIQTVPDLLKRRKRDPWKRLLSTHQQVPPAVGDRKFARKAS
jgi:bifunctional non-homologous end joining protein LigD